MWPFSILVRRFLDNLKELGPQPEIIRSGISRELEPLPGLEDGDELRDWDDGLLDCIGENLV